MTTTILGPLASDALLLFGFCIRPVEVLYHSRGGLVCILLTQCLFAFWSATGQHFQTMKWLARISASREIRACCLKKDETAFTSLQLQGSLVHGHVFFYLAVQGPPLSVWCNFKCHYRTQQSEQGRKQSQAGEEQKQNKKQGPSIGSPARIQKLIASQSDPLLAKEIFDLASREPDFQHSYATFNTLILKLGRSHQFSLMQSVLSSLKSQQYSVSPSLFSHIIQIYGEAGLPEKALKTFYTILEFNTKPLPRHLNLILEILVSHRNFLRPAFDLFKSAHKYGVLANTTSYNILMRTFCLNDDLSIAYSLFNQMFKRDIAPDVESYRILMQGLCRKSQVNKAVDLLEDMLNKGFVPDALSYSTLLNSLCRKKKLKEAYKILCRMKVKGCNPDIVHYNTVILGFCREGRAADACKVLEDMPSNGCLPNLISYRTLVGGLSDQGMYDEAKNYMVEMMSEGFSPHFSVVHGVVKGFCNIGKLEEACEVVEDILNHNEALHTDTWGEIVSRISEWDDAEKNWNILEEIIRAEIKPETRIVEVGSRLGEYLMNRIKSKSRKR